jgi:hypothetical protein
MFGKWWLPKAGIAVKLGAAVGLLAVTAAAVAWCGLYAISVYNAKVSAMQRASDRAIIGEQINGLINAVVMDSRGLYIAKTAQEIRSGPPGCASPLPGAFAGIRYAPHLHRDGCPA